MKSEPPDPGRGSRGDATHALIRSALGAIPFGGAAAIELFNAIVTPPIEKRRREWMESIGSALNELQSRQGAVDIARLSQDQEFISLLISVSQHAIKSHGREKLEALKNVVLNAASGYSPGEDLQSTFLALVDRFTPLHMRLLKIFHEGFVWSNEDYPMPDDLSLPPMLVPSIGSYGTLLEVDRTLLSIVLRDLISNDLIQHWIIENVTSTLPDGSFRCTVKQWKARSTSEMHVAHGVAILIKRKPGSYVTRTTHLAGQFVRFVLSPPV